MKKNRYISAAPAVTRQRRPLSALLIAAAMFSLASVAVLADDDHRGRGHDKHGNGYRQDYRHHEWRGEDRNYGYRPVYPRPYVYAQPVYVPPPVYYAPRQSPGISLFFPLDLR